MYFVIILHFFVKTWFIANMVQELQYLEWHYLYARKKTNEEAQRRLSSVIVKLKVSQNRLFEKKSGNVEQNQGYFLIFALLQSTKNWQWNLEKTFVKSKVLPANFSFCTIAKSQVSFNCCCKLLVSSVLNGSLSSPSVRPKSLVLKKWPKIFPCFSNLSGNFECSFHWFSSFLISFDFFRLISIFFR